MKKRFLTIFILLPFILSAQIDSLKGNIKSIREKLIFLDSNFQNRKLFSTEGEYGHYGFTSPEFTFSRFDSWWFHTTWVHYLNYERKYDTARNLTEETWYYTNDEVLAKITYEYDQLRQIIRKKTAYDDTRFFVKSSHYNESKLLVSSISYSSFTPIQYDYEIYRYDDHKNLVEIQTFDEYGENNGTKYTYTTSGKLKTSKQRHKNGNELVTEERFYDGSDNLIKVSHYLGYPNDGNNATLHSSTLYKYDSWNRKDREYYARSSDSPTVFRAYQYNENNLLVRESLIQARNDTALIDLQYYYNNLKNIEKLVYTGEGKTSVVLFSYKFDKEHNWIEQLKTVNGRPLYLRKRELIYY
jgi:hypothetical protein